MFKLGSIRSAFQILTRILPVTFKALKILQLQANDYQEQVIYPFNVSCQTLDFSRTFFPQLRLSGK